MLRPSGSSIRYIKRFRFGAQGMGLMGKARKCSLQSGFSVTEQLASKVHRCCIGLKPNPKKRRRTLEPKKALKPLQPEP